MKIISSDTSSIDIRLNESLTTAAGGVGDRGGIRFAITTDSGMIQQTAGPTNFQFIVFQIHF